MPVNISTATIWSNSTLEAAAIGGQIEWPLTVARVFYPLLIIGGVVGNLLAMLVLRGSTGGGSHRGDGAAAAREGGGATELGRPSARAAMRMSSHSRNVFTLLALADTVALLVNPPRYWLQSVFALDVRTLNDAACVVHSFLTYFSKDVATWALVLVSFERLLATLWPYRLVRYQSGASRYWLHGSVYGLLLLKNASILFKVHVLHNTARAQCDSEDRLYRRAFFFLDLVMYSCLPFAALIVCNSAILMALRRHRKSFSRSLHEHSVVASSSVACPSEAASRRQSKQTSILRRPPVSAAAVEASAHDNNKQSSAHQQPIAAPTAACISKTIALVNNNINNINNNNIIINNNNDERNHCSSLMPESARVRGLLKCDSTVSMVEMLSTAAEVSNVVNGLRGQRDQVRAKRSLRRLSYYVAEEADGEEAGMRPAQAETAIGETRTPKRHIESLPASNPKQTLKKVAPPSAQQSLATRLLLPVSIFHLVCTLPLSVLGVLDAIAEMRFAARTSAQMDRIFHLALLILMLAHLNHASNCVLYFVASQRFRGETRRVLRQLWHALFYWRAHARAHDVSSAARDAGDTTRWQTAATLRAPSASFSTHTHQSDAAVTASVILSPTADCAAHPHDEEDHMCSNSSMQSPNNGIRWPSDTHASTNCALQVTCTQIESSL